MLKFLITLEVVMKKMPKASQEKKLFWGGLKWKESDNKLNELTKLSETYKECLYKGEGDFTGAKKLQKEIERKLRGFSFFVCGFNVSGFIPNFLGNFFAKDTMDIYNKTMARINVPEGVITQQSITYVEKKGDNDEYKNIVNEVVDNWSNLSEQEKWLEQTGKNITNNGGKLKQLKQNINVVNTDVLKLQYMIKPLQLLLDDMEKTISGAWGETNKNASLKVKNNFVDDLQEFGKLFLAVATGNVGDIDKLEVENEKKEKVKLSAAKLTRNMMYCHVVSGKFFLQLMEAINTKAKNYTEKNKKINEKRRELKQKFAILEKGDGGFSLEKQAQRNQELEQLVKEHHDMALDYLYTIDKFLSVLEGMRQFLQSIDPSKNEQNSIFNNIISSITNIFMPVDNPSISTQSKNVKNVDDQNSEMRKEIEKQLKFCVRPDSLNKVVQQFIGVLVDTENDVIKSQGDEFKKTHEQQKNGNEQTFNDLKNKIALLANPAKDNENKGENIDKDIGDIFVLLNKAPVTPVKKNGPNSSTGKILQETVKNKSMEEFVKQFKKENNVGETKSSEEKSKKEEKQEKQKKQMEETKKELDNKIDGLFRSQSTQKNNELKQGEPEKPETEEEKKRRLEDEKEHYKLY